MNNTDKFEAKRIFENNDRLLTLRFKGNKEDEYLYLLKNFTNTIYLSKYFDKPENQAVLSEYKMTKREAIKQTVIITEKIHELLKQSINNIDKIFEPLDKTDESVPLTNRKPVFELPRQKLKQQWIRIYALKIENKYILITGGAIKQSQQMQEHPDTNAELVKINEVKSFLISQGITTIEGIYELAI